MRQNELINVMSRIQLDQEAYDSIYTNICENYVSIHKSYKEKTIQVLKYVSVIVIACTMGVIIYKPVKALVDSYIQTRIQTLPEEFVAEEIDRIDYGRTQADTYSRDYTETEIERMSELYILYKQEGFFPKQELRRVLTENDVVGEELYYVYETGTYHLPDRELTDEEILELIDYGIVENYVIEKNNEEMYHEVIGQNDTAKQQEQAMVLENNHITEYQAIQTALKVFENYFGMKARQFEQTSCFEHAEDSYFARDCYHVNWCNIITHEYYYFYVDAYSGELFEIWYSNGKFQELPLFTEETFAQIQTSFIEEATCFLQEQLGISGEFIAKTYFINEKATDARYGIVELISNTDELEEAYVFSFSSDGKFSEYSHKKGETYEEYKTKQKLLNRSDICETDIII